MTQRGVWLTGKDKNLLSSAKFPGAKMWAGPLGLTCSSCIRLYIYIYVVGTSGVHFARDRMCTLDEPSQLLTS